MITDEQKEPQGEETSAENSEASSEQGTETTPEISETQEEGGESGVENAGAQEPGDGAEAGVTGEGAPSVDPRYENPLLNYKAPRFSSVKEAINDRIKQFEKQMFINEDLMMSYLFRGNVHEAYYQNWMTHVNHDFRAICIFRRRQERYAADVAANSESAAQEAASPSEELEHATVESEPSGDEQASSAPENADESAKVDESA